jgi:hypothetical protein
MSLAQLCSRVEKIEAKLAPAIEIPYLTPVDMALEAGIELDDWQADLVSSNALHVLANCSRQSGKSLSAAVVAVWTMQYIPDSTVLLLSPSLRQSVELFKKCMHVFNHLKYRLPIRTETALQLSVSNGSRIVSLPGIEATVRSYSAVRLAIFDEASRIPDSLLFAVRPMLAVSNGRLMMLSTPNGIRGVFYEAYCDKDSWDYYEINAEMCPRISKAFLAKEKEDIGSFWYEQEYMNKFHADVNSAFRAEDIARIIDKNIVPWDI